MTTGNTPLPTPSSSLPLTLDDVEARALYDESVEAERQIGQCLADEVITHEGVWTPLQTALAVQLKEQARVTEVLRKQVVLVVSG